MTTPKTTGTADQNLAEVLPAETREQLHHEWIPACERRRRRLYGELNQAAGRDVAGAAAGGPR